MTVSSPKVEIPSVTGQNLLIGQGCHSVATAAYSERRNRGSMSQNTPRGGDDAVGRDDGGSYGDGDGDGGGRDPAACPLFLGTGCLTLNCSITWRGSDGLTTAISANPESTATCTHADVRCVLCFAGRCWCHSSPGWP